MKTSEKFIKGALALIVVGVWIIVFQNLGIIPRLKPVVVEAHSALPVSGEVEVNNTVFIKGSVDANIESINGYSKFYKDPRTGEYYVIPVTDPYE
ncbi:MAG: hypothetical protein H8E34_00745 [Bacteroidetes bacterium]|nr:hypothetical protein [Bacteroidota bacterium]MBL6944552.1 hypothetical protein [Bacteroidales bacterium]